MIIVEHLFCFWDNRLDRIGLDRPTAQKQKTLRRFAKGGAHLRIKSLLNKRLKNPRTNVHFVVF